MKPEDITREQVIAAMKKLGHPVFESDKKNFNLNLIGIRADSRVPGEFDDLFVVMWKYQGVWEFHVHTGTTDPGTYWLNNPLSSMGTAILKPGHYKGGWQKGKHQGKYAALVQRTEVTVLRDNDKDSELDFDTANEETGWFGINHHRANANTESIQVGKWSAGCQVRNDPDEYDEFMGWIDAAIAIYGNSFSYTLIEEKDLA